VRPQNKVMLDKHMTKLSSRPALVAPQLSLPPPPPPPRPAVRL
jgi:hypothetical protein